MTGPRPALRPRWTRRARFCSYIAESAACTAPGNPVTTLYGANPNEPATPDERIARSARRTRSPASSRVTPGTTMPNSSPPRRASTSASRTVRARTSAARRM